MQASVVGSEVTREHGVGGLDRIIGSLALQFPGRDVYCGQAGGNMAGMLLSYRMSPMPVNGGKLQIRFIQAAGPGFKETAVTAGPVMSNRIN